MISGGILLKRFYVISGWILFETFLERAYVEESGRGVDANISLLSTLIFSKLIPHPEESGKFFCIFGCYLFYRYFSKTNEYTNIVINISILKVSLLLIFFLNIRISVIVRT